MGKPIVQIFTLSRLVFADVTDWQRILKDLRESRKSMYWSYKPLREGAVKMASLKQSDTNEIYSSVGQLAEKAGGPRCRKANVDALAKFESNFLPRIEKMNTNLMQQGAEPVDFGEVQLVGGPHFRITVAGGEEKLVYLHPSKWTDEEVTAFCELLTVVCEKRFNATARDLWFLDLRTGERLPWNNSKKLVRRKCEKAAEFLVALQAANLAGDES